jgi:hypothetical protein
MAATAVLSVTALFFSIGGAGWAANGGAFILGVINGATQRTFLGANFDGAALQVNNTSAGMSAVPLQLMAAAGHPPMKVNTVAKVINLNADYVDGIDASTQLTRVMRIPFNLPANSSTFPITVPANVPVQLIGVTLGSSPASVGQASLLRIPSEFIEWNGLDSTWAGSGAFVHGYSAVIGTVIVHIDYSHQVAVAVAGADTIRIDNHAGGPRSGSVTLMW